MKMPRKELDEKREEMIQFLLENIVGEGVSRDDNDVVFTGIADRKFRIRTLSKQEDFPSEFESDPRQFDNDKRRLQTIRNEISDFVRVQNYDGCIPGFVLLRADIDFSQLKNRTQPLVNEGHFLKQKIDSEAHSDERVIDPFELALHQHYRSVYYGPSKDKRVGKVSGGGFGPYYHELIYFNSKTHMVEIVAFGNVGNSKLWFDRCPVCENPNGRGYDHEPCKSDRAYLKYVKERKKARYEKRILISRRRRTIDSKCQKEAEKGVIFKPAMLDHTKLVLPSEQYLAVVK